LDESLARLEATAQREQADILREMAETERLSDDD
jgi:hypothetical protein